jgi:hypothetical protein
MRHRLIDRFRSVRLTAVVVAALAGFGLHSASAQYLGAPGAKPQQIVRQPGKVAPLVTSGSGPYYIEFRSRFSWDYGHTYIVHGRVGEAPTRASVAGLSPVGDDATAWVIGHYVPVPAETAISRTNTSRRAIACS